jgi:hypothetical protein
MAKQEEIKTDMISNRFNELEFGSLGTSLANTSTLRNHMPPGIRNPVHEDVDQLLKNINEQGIATNDPTYAEKVSRLFLSFDQLAQLYQFY